MIDSEKGRTSRSILRGSAAPCSPPKQVHAPLRKGPPTCTPVNDTSSLSKYLTPPSSPQSAGALKRSSANRFTELVPAKKLKKLEEVLAHPVKIQVTAAAEKQPEAGKRAATKLPPRVATFLDGVAQRVSNETKWSGGPISPDEVAAKWPEHQDMNITDSVMSQWKASHDQKHDGSCLELEIIAHFRTVEIEKFQFSLGDFIEVSLDTAAGSGIGQVLELFETVQGERMCSVHWFYPPQETRLACEPKSTKKVKVNTKEFDPVPVPLGKRIFMATDRDNEGYNRSCNLDAVNKVLKVLRVPAGDPEPSAEVLKHFDYWWELMYDNRHYEFINPGVPASRAKYANQTSPRVIRALDLYCGCGGMSEMDIETDDVIIQTSWSVDIESDMCDSFQANHPKAHVHCMGVDEFEWLCRKFKELSEKYPEGCPELLEDMEDDTDSDDEPLPKGIFEVEELLDIRLADEALRKTSGVAKGQLVEGLTDEKCWLEFLTHWKGYDDPSEHTWQKLDSLDSCIGKVARFVQKFREAGRIPLPGMVDLVMGGPPCQGVSGLNRHATRVNVLEDVRNRQALAFYRIVDYLQPAFVLMEQVQDIFKKEDGLYAKFASAELVKLRYQCRSGVIAAASHGVPQGRYRVFMWGAKSGQEQLPPFPEPTHRAFYRTPVPMKAKECLVDFISEENRKKAYPPVVIGDMLSDLPEVSNFCLTERASYATPPQTPFQLWLRRPPPAYQPTAEERGEAADAMMQPGHDGLNKRMRELLKKGTQDSLAELGRLFFNKRDPQGKAGLKSFAGIVWTKYLESLKSPAERERAAADMQKKKRDLAIDIGTKVKKELSVEAKGAGPLRDHRPLVCNVDDYLRMCGVPRGRAVNFRQLEGVVVNEDGRVCSGHTHVAQDEKGNTSCLGGGTRTQAPSSTTKAGRVDYHDKDGWRGIQIEGCAGRTVFLPSGDLLAPRWVITYQKGKSNGRAGCFGRFHEAEVQPTVVGRAEPHNLAIVHPRQDRVVTVLENKRCQGFPDYYCLVGKAERKGVAEKTWVRSNALNQRYKQIGNAVCPEVARALGRCLVMAAVGKAPLNQPVVSVPDPEYEATMAEARRLGLKCYVESHPDELYGLRGGKFKGSDLMSAAVDAAISDAEALEDAEAEDEDDVPGMDD